VIAWKFLGAGRTGPISGFEWPPAGVWLHAGGTELRTCRTAIHACTAQDLPLWLGEELWTIELIGPVEHAHGKLAAPGGRLLAQVEDWDAIAAVAYADACADRAEKLAEAGDAAAAGLIADARRCARRAGRTGYDAPTMAAGAAMCAARVRALYDAGGVAAERAWQAAWLCDRLGVT
jgi:hypothetical protein